LFAALCSGIYRFKGIASFSISREIFIAISHADTRLNQHSFSESPMIFSYTIRQSRRIFNPPDKSVGIK
jgi:hypothetical protein